MKKQINDIKKARLYLLNLVKDVSVEQLNKVPLGFNNNIIWNLGHLMAAQQGVGYLRAGVKPAIEEKMIASYKSGTKPEGYINENEVARVKELFISSLDTFESDYQNQLFKNYIPWTTRYGVELTSIEDAITFLAYHEGLHAGTIMALKKLVSQ